MCHKYFRMHLENKICRSGHLCITTVFSIKLSCHTFIKKKLKMQFRCLDIATGHTAMIIFQIQLYSKQKL